ncbi:MAG TPA: glycoside hydrolase family 30 protein [Mobilitalea sp.]|nr:glycoside hydrolase family 30 protein [Mobilitalea sp.]
MKIKHVVSYENNCWQEETFTKGIISKDTLELTGEKVQEILGFGGCFNELGWAALQLIPEDKRNEFLDELFLEEKCNFNYGRVPIGANDFSLEWYSCDEVTDDYELKHFNIERDKKYTIPFIREAQKRQQQFCVFASPWSPPIWMKTKKAYNYGVIRKEEEVLQSYANYFVKFVQEYRKENVLVSQVHVQNEPMADQKFPSCMWNGEQMRDFIKYHLGPQFEKARLDTQLWLGTINGPFVDFMMPGMSAPFSEFYDQFANTILSDEKARGYLHGVGLQWGGKHVMEQIAVSYPEMHYMQTESECGDGLNSWEHMEYIFNQMWFYFRHGAERYTYWNMALEDGGISSWGWKQNSLCTINPETKEFILQPEFYLMKHFSHFVKKGARLLQTKGHWTSNTVAFENQDGSIILIVASNMNRDREFSFVYGEKTFSAVIKAHSIHTFQLLSD